jgi:long-chain acyl-CoA synthetase
MTKDHLGAMLRESARVHGARPAMRHKVAGAWTTISYAQLGERVRAVARALVEAGVEPGAMVGVFARNSPEWAIADFAILTVGAVSVPIYPTSTAEQADHIARDAGLEVVFTGDQSQHDTLMVYGARSTRLRKVIVFDRAARLSDPRAVAFEAFEQLGMASRRDDEVERRLAAATGEDLATLIYTSGTTGDPKGAELTHANFFHQFRALDERFRVDHRDRSLCFLPLSHAYERTWSYYVLRSGAENAYLLDPKDVISCMPEVRPTAMVSVPRLYEKICAAVLDRVRRGSAPRRALFQWAMAIGSDFQGRQHAGKPAGPLLALKHRLADALVLSKIRAVVGGEKNFFSAGGAPLSKEVEEFFFAAGLLVCQGYGLTETAPMLSCNAPGAFRFGTVGRPVLGCEIRIAESGEILARGANVMRGYHGRPAETAAVFEDGWFKTGDVGVLDEDGYLRITDRLKDLIITSGGKNVAPQQIEARFGGDPLVDQVAIIGDRRPYLTALLVPAFPALEAHAREAGITFSSREELVAAPAVVALYEERVQRVSKGLAGYQQIKRFTLLPRELTQEGGEITPTLKIKRRVVEQKYRALIDAMYAERRAPGPGA